MALYGKGIVRLLLTRPGRIDSFINLVFWVSCSTLASMLMIFAFSVCPCSSAGRARPW